MEVIEHRTRNLSSHIKLGVALAMDIPLALGPIFFLAITTAAVQYTIPQDEWYVDPVYHLKKNFCKVSVLTYEHGIGPSSISVHLCSC